MENSNKPKRRTNEEIITQAFLEKKYYFGMKKYLELKHEWYEFTDVFLEQISWELSYFEWFDASSINKLNQSIYNFVNNPEFNNNNRDWYEATKKIIDSMEHIKSQTHATITLDLRNPDLIDYYTKYFVNLRLTKDLSILINFLQRFLDIKDKIRSRTVYNLILKFFEEKEELSYQEEYFKEYFLETLAPNFKNMLETWDYMTSSKALEFNTNLLELFENDSKSRVKEYFELEHKDISTHIIFIENASDEDLLKAFHRYYYQYLYAWNVDNKKFYTSIISRFLNLVWREEEFFCNFPIFIKLAAKNASSLDENLQERYNDFLANEEKYSKIDGNFFKDDTINFIKLKLRMDLSNTDEKEIIKLSSKYDQEEKEWFYIMWEQKFEHSLKSEILEYFFTNNEKEKAIMFFKRIPGKTKLMLLLFILNSSSKDIEDSFPIIFDYFLKEKVFSWSFWNQTRWFNLLRDIDIFNKLSEKLNWDKKDEILDILQVQFSRHRWYEVKWREISNLSKVKSHMWELILMSYWDLSPKRRINKILKLLEKWNPEDALMLSEALFKWEE